MAIFTTNNLFPGTIDTSMPGFLVDDDEVKVYFDISPYNDISDIKENYDEDTKGYIQVSLRYQNNNLNALNEPSGIVLKPYKNDDDGKGYYFIVSAEDLEKGKFLPYSYYKLQFRLTDIAASDIGEDTVDEWLSSESTEEGKTNLDESSEWSTICLIRGITAMNLDVEEFSEDTSITNIVSDLDKITGYIGFTTPDTGEEITEYLKSYQIKLYDKNNVLVKDSGEILCDTYQALNRFTYNFYYNFLTGSTNTYTVEITCTTNTLYQYTFDAYTFYIDPGTAQITFNPTFTASADEESGIIKLKLIYTNSSPAATTLKIKRSCAKDNYTEKKEVYSGTFVTGTGQTTISYLDTSVESGILYKYYVSVEDDSTPKKKSNETQLSSPIGVVLNHIFLKRGKQQLKIKFNPQVSSMKTIYQENKTDTLGSQFPYIRRNGAVKYRTFPISGLISYFMDDENLFSSRSYEYGDNLNAYNTFNTNNNITEMTDYTYERLFRERVKEFLEDGEIKLFRSPTEGNVLVRLMEVNFSPNTNNGRMIWTFSATAYEMADPNLDNMEKYNIKPVIAATDNYGSNSYTGVVNLTSHMPHVNGVL